MRSWTSTLVGDDPVLSAALEASNAAGLPRIAVSVQQGKFLSLLAGAMQARRILEIGTLGGFSSIWLARGAGPEGRVLTLEYEPKHAEVARANLQRAGVGDRVRGGGRRRAGHAADADRRALRSGVH